LGAYYEGDRTKRSDQLRTFFKPAGIEGVGSGEPSRRHAVLISSAMIGSGHPQTWRWQ